MAAKNVTATASERMQIALQAAWQIADLFDELVAQGASLNTGDREAAVIRALAIRGRKLASATMSALDDETGTIDDARRIVYAGQPVREVANG